jgi:hypothetical protein
MDNPVQTECSTGLGNHNIRNCVAVQPKTFVYVERVELLRSSDWGEVPNPVLRCTCTGLSMLKSYGLKNHEQYITFTLIRRERLQKCILKPF